MGGWFLLSQVRKQIGAIDDPLLGSARAHRDSRRHRQPLIHHDPSAMMPAMMWAPGKNVEFFVEVKNPRKHKPHNYIVCVFRNFCEWYSQHCLSRKGRQTSVCWCILCALDSHFCLPVRALWSSFYLKPLFSDSSEDRCCICTSVESLTSELSSIIDNG